MERKENSRVKIYVSKRTYVKRILEEMKRKESGTGEE